MFQISTIIHNNLFKLDFVLKKIHFFTTFTIENKRLFGSKEFAIPVPWGHITGKEWGFPSGDPWICLHGFLDNCGSFDAIVPLLIKFDEEKMNKDEPSTKADSETVSNVKPRKRFICVDLPGHGFSSHYPKANFYNYIENLLSIRRVANFFNFEKFSLMGHSMGGGLSFLYAATHPKIISNLVMLDSIKPISREPHQFTDKCRQSIDEFFLYEEKLNKSAPVYSYEKCLKLRMNALNILNSFGKEDHTISVNEKDCQEVAKILLKRGMVENDTKTGFIFSRDIRLHITSMIGLTQETLNNFASKIQCPHLIIRCIDGATFESDKHSQEILDILSKNKDFEIMDINGWHHAHINEAPKIAAIIENFLKKNE